MPDIKQRTRARQTEERRLREQPHLILMRYCETCAASNATLPGDPPPTHCASCGSPYAPPPSWSGKTPPHRPGPWV